MNLTVNGAGVYAHTGGVSFDATRPAAVFVHGAGMDHTVWALQARYIAHHGFAVLAVDLPGHGRSDGPALASIEAIADWTVDLLDAVGVAAAALIGHSMGAIACLEAASRAPTRASKLVLCGAAERMAVHPDLIAAAESDPALARDLIVDWAFGAHGRVGGNRAAGLWLMATAQRLIDRAGAGVLANDFRACDAYQGGAAAAARIACPVLLILGREDRMTPAKAGRALGKTMKDVTIAEIQDCGHMMMVEQPDETLDSLRRFLGTS